MNSIQFAVNHPVGFFGDISILLAFVYSFPLAIPSNRAVLLFKAYVFWLTFLHLVSFWLASEHINNLFLYNINLPIQVVIMLRLFGSLIDKPLMNRVLTGIALLFCVFFVVDLVMSNPDMMDWHNHRMNRYAHVVADGLMIMLVLFFFWQLTVALTVPNLIRYPFFWVACALLVYSAGSVFMAPFFFYDNIWNSTLNLDVLQNIENWVIIICNGLFGIAMWQIRQAARPVPISRQV
jgi:hypothetical protein